MAPRRAHPEEDLQRAVVAHLHLRARPGVGWSHIPNGGKRGIVEAVAFKAMGVRAGMPDLMLWAPHEKMRFLELKAKRGRLSEAQRVVISDLEAAGFECEVAHSLDEALEILECWGLIRPNLNKSSEYAA